MCSGYRVAEKWNLESMILAASTGLPRLQWWMISVAEEHDIHTLHAGWGILSTHCPPPLEPTVDWTRGSCRPVTDFLDYDVIPLPDLITIRQPGCELS